MILVPNSNGEDNRPVREFNPHHDARGRFARGATTRVGITSARPGQTEGIYARMREFEGELRAVPGVSKVSVREGVGAWKGGSEKSWIVGYVGNGEARTLLAKTAVRYQQEAVLVMGRCQGDRRACDPAVDLRFDHSLAVNEMAAINGVLGQAGFGGWTWGTVGGKPVLRVVSVPAWGGNTQKHLLRMRMVTHELTKQGHTHKYSVRWMKTSVLDESNYAAVIAGKG